MKIVSRQTLQNLIRHQLLEHYTKKISLLTENAIPNTETLIKSINEILPDDSSIIFSNDYTGYPKGSYINESTATASQLGYARTGLVLNCLYELLNDASIQKKLSDEKIVIDAGIKKFFIDKILGFFTSIKKNAGDDTLIISAEDFNTKIINLKKEIGSKIDSLPDFLKFLLKDPSVILEQLTDAKVFNAWNLAWFNSEKSVALITNPGLEGSLSYEGNVKSDIVAPLTESLNTLIPKFKEETGATVDATKEEKKGDNVKSNADKNTENPSKEGLLAKAQKAKEENKASLRKKIGDIGSFTSDKISSEDDVQKIYLYLTELYIYHIFLGASTAINSKDPTIIYTVNPNIKALINKIINDNDNTNLVNEQLSQLDLNLYDIFWINDDEEALLLTDDNTKTIKNLLKLLEKKRKDVLEKINKIKKDTPVAFNIKLFLKTLTQTNIEEIYDKILNGKRWGSYFSLLGLNNPDKKIIKTPYRITNNAAVINIIGNYFSETQFWDEKISQTKEDSKNIETSQTELKTLESSEFVISPDRKVISDEDWTKLLKNIEKNKNPNERNPAEIKTIKEIIKNLQKKGIDIKEIEESLKELEEKEKVEKSDDNGDAAKAKESVEEKKSETADTNKTSSDSEKTIETEQSQEQNELETIFRLPQLNKGWRQLAEILSSANALRNYKSGNFKKGKYDKADSYGYIFMEDSKFDRISNLSNIAIKTLEGLKGIKLGTDAIKKIENSFKDYKKIGNYLNDYFNKKMLLANEYLLIDVAVVFYLALRVLEEMGLESNEFQKLHQEYVVDKDPIVIPHNVKITNLDDIIAKKVDLSKRISIEQMFKNRKAKNTVTQKTETTQSQTTSSSESPTPIEDEDILATKSLKRVKALITQLGGKMFKQDIEDDDLITRAANGQYSKGQLGREIVQIANTVYQRADDFDFNEFEKKQLKLGLQNYFEQKLSNYNGTDALIQSINNKINQL